MTTAFQSVINNAESISINTKRKITQTSARDGTVKATSIGGQLWEFSVKLPDGPSWSSYRGIIESIEALDRVTAGQIQINSAGHTWLSGYQGNLTDVSAITVSYTSGNTLTITGGATLASGFRFKAGDFIQLGTAGVYRVVSDVAFNSNTITVHRPVREAAGTYTLKVGPACVWTVICVQFPQWRIFARDQVSWDGDFIFVESV